MDSYSYYVDGDVWACGVYEVEEYDEDMDDLGTAIFILMVLLVCTCCCCCCLQRSKAKEIRRLEMKLSIANSKAQLL